MAPATPEDPRRARDEHYDQARRELYLKIMVVSEKSEPLAVYAMFTAIHELLLRYIRSPHMPDLDIIESIVDLKLDLGARVLGCTNLSNERQAQVLNISDQLVTDLVGEPLDDSDEGDFPDEGASSLSPWDE